jgi:hypothetical protein
LSEVALFNSIDSNLYSSIVSSRISLISSLNLFMLTLMAGYYGKLSVGDLPPNNIGSY